MKPPLAFSAFYYSKLTPTRVQTFPRLTLLIPKTVNSLPITIQRIHRRPCRQIGPDVRTHKEHCIKRGFSGPSRKRFPHGCRSADGHQILRHLLLPQIPNTIEIGVMDHENRIVGGRVDIRFLYQWVSKCTGKSFAREGVRERE